MAPVLLPLRYGAVAIFKGLCQPLDSQLLDSSFFSSYRSSIFVAITKHLPSICGKGSIPRTFKMAKKTHAIPSPRDTVLPFLFSAQAAVLPKLFPGARDVGSPYGTMRLYEWGPEEGRKILMIHGDTTPAPIFGPIANGMVDRGCRVLLLGQS